MRETLAAHPDGRAGPCVFLHTPLWEEEYPDKSGWPAIEAALQGRKYTVFAGHYHDYLRRVRHDSRYYILATTGGGSALRGPAYGEFDQVAWVTMTNDGPLVANLLLDGIRADTIRTPESRALVQAINRAGAVQTDILWYNPGEKPASRAELRCVNPLDLPVKLTYQLTSPAGIRADLSPRFAPAPDGRQTFVAPAQGHAQPRPHVRRRPADASPPGAGGGRVQVGGRLQPDGPGAPPPAGESHRPDRAAPQTRPPRRGAHRGCLCRGLARAPPGTISRRRRTSSSGLETWTGPADCSFRLGGRPR
ncbi:MAG: hypothetical protein V9E83_03785 [Baekduia sp.]